MNQGCGMRDEFRESIYVTSLMSGRVPRVVTRIFCFSCFFQRKRSVAFSLDVLFFTFSMLIRESFIKVLRAITRIMRLRTQCHEENGFRNIVLLFQFFNLIVDDYVYMHISACF